MRILRRLFGGQQDDGILEGVRLTEELLGERQRRERALLAVLDLSKSGNPLGCAALDVAILIKSHGKEGRYAPGVRVHSIGPAEVLQSAMQSILEMARGRSLLHDPRTSGDLIAQFMTFAGPEAQEQLMLDILSAGGDESLHAFQLLGTDLQATASLKQQLTDPKNASYVNMRFEQLRLGLLKSTGDLAEAHGWR